MAVTMLVGHGLSVRKMCRPVTKGVITEPSSQAKDEHVNGVWGFTALNTHFFPLTRRVNVEPTADDDSFSFLLLDDAVRREKKQLLHRRDKDEKAKKKPRFSLQRKSEEDRRRSMNRRREAEVLPWNRGTIFPCSLWEFLIVPRCSGYGKGIFLWENGRSHCLLPYSPWIIEKS